MLITFSWYGLWVLGGFVKIWFWPWYYCCLLLLGSGGVGVWCLLLLRHDAFGLLAGLLNSVGHLWVFYGVVIIVCFCFGCLIVACKRFGLVCVAIWFVI